MNKLLRKVSVGILVVLFIVSCATSGVKSEKEINAITPVAEAPASVKEEAAPAAVMEETAPAPLKEEPAPVPQAAETSAKPEAGTKTETVSSQVTETALKTEAETKVEEKTAEEEKPLLETELAYMGMKAEVSAYRTHALIRLPEGTTEADIVKIVKSFPSGISTEGFTYTFHDGILELTYPSLTPEFLEF